ncbi:MAG TPA: hypothetical protein VMF06_00345, partial [Candidatus Limnocylindria bacterium]|nr:hypothetical protein [Candidatus Limnocylindria bacterium]
MIRHFLFFIILGFAFRTQAADEIALVGVGDIWHFTNATTAHPAPRNWQKPSFIPQKWPQGGSGFGDTGYGENTLLKPLPGDWHNLLIRR